MKTISGRIIEVIKLSLFYYIACLERKDYHMYCLDQKNVEDHPLAAQTTQREEETKQC